MSWLKLLRSTAAKLKRLSDLLLAYDYHCRANRALGLLRLHSDRDLRDIGLTRGELYTAAHRGCGWCGTEWGRGSDDDLGA